MPVLAVADVGNGRSIALGVDGGWLLQFSELGARTGGRGHGALWDGLLGWLMRDPRFEPAQIELHALLRRRALDDARRARRPRECARADVEPRGHPHRRPDGEGGASSERRHARRDPRRSTSRRFPLAAYSALAARRRGPDDAARLRVRGRRRRVGRLAARRRTRLRALADATGGSFRFATTTWPRSPCRSRPS